MKFKNLEIQNFMSIKKASTTLNDRGLILIRGENTDEESFDSNGSGKSSIFSEAPSWCLYGETIRGLKGDEIINRSVGKNTRVSLSIESDNKDIYTIIRHRKHNEHKNNVLFFRNENNITGRSDTETNLMIVDLLQMDYLTFTNSIMFGQGIAKMFAESPDGDQKKILERILQIDIFKLCQEKAKEYHSAIEKRITGIEVDILSNKKLIASDVSTIETLERKEEELRGTVGKRILELRSEKIGYELEIENIPSTDYLLEGKVVLEELKKSLDFQMQGYKDYEDTMSELLVEKGVYSNALKKAKSSIDTANRQLSDIRKGKNIPKICDKCGSTLPLNDTKKIEKHLEDDIAKTTETVMDAEKEIAEIAHLIEAIGTKLLGKKELEKQKNVTQEGINDIMVQVNSTISKKKSLTRLCQTVEERIKEQEDMLGVTYEGLIQSTRKHMEKLEQEVVTLSESIGDLAEDKKNYSFWVNSFGNQGIKSVLLDSVTPYLNQQANGYLAQLTDSSIEVKFNTQTQLKSGEFRDKFSVEVINSNGDDQYKGNSGGEKRRVDIAINMALQDLVQSRSNKSVDLIVYDEMYDGLDAIGCERVIQLLQEKAKTCGTILVITHNDHLKQLFNKEIVLSKENGETKIIED